MSSDAPALKPTSVILVAEDNPEDAFFLRRAFAKLGLGGAVVVVPNGQHVLKYLKREPPYDDPLLCPRPALLLLDANTPLLSGFEVLAWLRQTPEAAGIPALLYTSCLRSAEQERARSLGAQAFLEKPMDSESWQKLARSVWQFYQANSPSPPP